MAEEPFPEPIARIYDRVFADPEETRTEIAGLRAAIERFAGRKVKRILDLAAGTGRIALPLAEAGYHVTALDAAPAMLRVLSERAGAQGLTERVTPVLGRAEGLAGRDELRGAFDAAFCLDSFYYFADEGLPEKVLAAVAGALQPGGIFVFDVYNYFFADPVDEERTVATELEGREILVVGQPVLLRSENLLLYTNRVEIRQPDGSLFVHEQTATYRHFTPLELATYCRAAGFDKVRQFPGLGVLLPEGRPDDSVLVTVARR